MLNRMNAGRLGINYGLRWESMKNSGRLAPAYFLAVVALCTIGAGQDAPPTFPTQLEQVTVDVVVTDAKGAPIQGLKAEDLRVLEDGVPQSIVSFEAFVAPSPDA